MDPLAIVTAFEYRLGDVGCGQSGVFECRLARLDRPIDQIVTNASSSARVMVIVKCVGPASSAVMVGRFIFGLQCRGKLNLGLFRCFLQALQGQSVPPQRDALLLLDLLGEIINEPLGEILTVSVDTVRGLGSIGTVGSTHFSRSRRSC